MTAQRGPTRFARVRGEVAAFDEAAGWGTVRSDDGEEWFFHCTQVADGSRTIPVGVTVTAEVLPLGLGTWEAADVTVVG